MTKPSCNIVFAHFLFGHGQTHTTYITQRITGTQHNVSQAHNTTYHRHTISRKLSKRALPFVLLNKIVSTTTAHVHQLR